jgi:hypothetical protein
MDIYRYIGKTGIKHKINDISEGGGRHNSKHDLFAAY